MQRIQLVMSQYNLRWKFTAEDVSNQAFGSTKASRADALISVKVLVLNINYVQFVFKKLNNTVLLGYTQHILMTLWYSN